MPHVHWVEARSRCFSEFSLRPHLHGNDFKWKRKTFIFCTWICNFLKTANKVKRFEKAIFEPLLLLYRRTIVVVNGFFLHLRESMNNNKFSRNLAVLQLRVTVLRVQLGCLSLWMSVFSHCVDSLDKQRPLVSCMLTTLFFSVSFVTVWTDIISTMSNWEMMSFHLNCVNEGRSPIVTESLHHLVVGGDITTQTLYVDSWLACLRQ